MKRILLAALFLFTASAGAASADSAITIADPHVRLVPPNAENTAIFMVIRNQGAKDVKLVAAESTSAKAVELHTVIEEEGMKKMRPVADIPVKAHGETVLKPGDYHIMLIGLNQPLKEGNEIAFTLKFNDGSSQSLKAPVRKIQMPMAH